MCNAYQISPVFLCDPCGEKRFAVSIWEKHPPQGAQGNTGEIKLDLRPQIGSWVFWIELRQLAEEFLRALVSWHGDMDRDLHDLIAASAFSCGGRDTLLAQTQLLTGLRARRNLQ